MTRYQGIVALVLAQSGQPAEEVARRRLGREERSNGASVSANRTQATGMIALVAETAAGWRRRQARGERTDPL